MTLVASYLTSPSHQGVAASSLLAVELGLMVVTEKGLRDMRRPLIEHIAVDHVRACLSMYLPPSLPVSLVVTACTDNYIDFLYFSH